MEVLPLSHAACDNLPSQNPGRSNLCATDTNRTVLVKLHLGHTTSSAMYQQENKKGCKDRRPHPKEKPFLKPAGLSAFTSRMNYSENCQVLHTGRVYHWHHNVTPESRWKRWNAPTTAPAVGRSAPGANRWRTEGEVRETTTHLH